MLLAQWLRKRGPTSTSVPRRTSWGTTPPRTRAAPRRVRGSPARNAALRQHRVPDVCDPYIRMAPETTRPVASPRDEQQRCCGARGDRCICPAERKTARRRDPLVSLTEVGQQRFPRAARCLHDPDPAPFASARGLTGSASAVREASANYLDAAPRRSPKRNRQERGGRTSALPRTQSSRRGQRTAASARRCISRAVRGRRRPPRHCFPDGVGRPPGQEQSSCLGHARDRNARRAIAWRPVPRRSLLALDPADRRSCSGDVATIVPDLGCGHAVPRHGVRPKDPSGSGVGLARCLALAGSRQRPASA